MENSLECCFPNVETPLRIYLSLMVTNCTGERLFLKLKQIKNELRTTMSQNRLNNFTLMSIEHEILHQLNVSDIINKFSHAKAQRAQFPYQLQVKVQRQLLFTDGDSETKQVVSLQEGCVTAILHWNWFQGFFDFNDFNIIHVKIIIIIVIIKVHHLLSFFLLVTHYTFSLLLFTVDFRFRISTLV
ncbi:hypothetical protein PR048_000788 [Dryococelus australis]|uniref:HAT C-terminal dimerisation domain-containing protein n=1 Tax=Dryococelus australis TaxID=614101 RepID=A0ABQ9IFL1_9NEOP|nr:hypothetical protein PR048_000788 [Dryococelus australis]